MASRRRRNRAREATGVHGFHNPSTVSATLLVMHHPAGFEQSLEEMQKLAARHGSNEDRGRTGGSFRHDRRAGICGGLAPVIKRQPREIGRVERPPCSSCRTLESGSQPAGFCSELLGVYGRAVDATG